MYNKQKKAEVIYNLYFALGENRSLAKLKRYLEEHYPNNPEMNPSLPTLKRWSRQYNWRLRAQQGDVEVRKKMKDDVLQDVVDIKAEYRKLIRGTLAEAVKAVKEMKKKKIVMNVGKVKDYVMLVDAMERLMRLEMELLGESGEGTVVVNITGDLLPKKDNGSQPA
jgi:hypothetical protein